MNHISTTSVHAFLVCDCVIEDSLTEKIFFRHLHSHPALSFPFQHPAIGLVLLHDRRCGNLQIRYRPRVRQKPSTHLLRRTSHIVIGDHLQISDFGTNIPALVFPAPGRYDFACARTAM